MRYWPLALALILGLALPGTAGARDIAEMFQIVSKPMIIEGGESKHMDVTFNHLAHRGINCMDCHHKKLRNERYVSCRECHNVAGARTRGEKSMFVAFHSRKERTCFGCHKQKLKQNPDRFAAVFAGCTPCHVDPLTDEIRKATVDALKMELLSAPPK